MNSSQYFSGWAIGDKLVANAIGDVIDGDTLYSEAPTTLTAQYQDTVPLEYFIFENNNSSDSYSIGYNRKAGDFIYDSIVLPNTYEGKPISRIQNNGFKNILALRNITLGDNIAEIGDSAFAYCNELTNITIPRGSDQYR